MIIRKFLALSLLSLFVVPLLAAEIRTSGEYLIKFRDSATSEGAKRYTLPRGVQLSAKFAASGLNLIRAAENSLSQAELKLLNSHPAVEYVEPNITYSLSHFPNDSVFPELWGLHNEQASTVSNTSIDIDAPEAWEQNAFGNEQVIAVLDTGVNLQHPDLRPVIWKNFGEVPENGIDDDENGVVDDVFGFNAIETGLPPDDDHGHGSHVAGIIAASENGFGVVGVANKARIMPLKFLNRSGTGTLANAIAAIEYVIAMKRRGVNVRVINASWGGPTYSMALHDAIKAAIDEGIIFVAAAGNSAADNDARPSYPASYISDGVVSVSAIEKQGNLATFSSYGATSVDIAAPGADIKSAWLGNEIHSLNGTSMAAPHVSAVAALIFERNPQFAPADVRLQLMLTARRLESLRHTNRSSGLVNAARAVRNERSPLPAELPAVRYRQTTSTQETPALGGQLILQQDEGYREIQLPFSFPFYNAQINRLAVSANGRVIPLDAVETLPTESDYSNQLRSGLLPYHDDLYPTGNCGSSGKCGVYAEIGEEKVTIHWLALPFAIRYRSGEAEAPIHVALEIQKNGSITFHYPDTFSNSELSDYGANATIGIAPSSGISGEPLLFAHNKRSEKFSEANARLTFKLLDSYIHNDVDGDFQSDIIVWRPQSGNWFLLLSTESFSFDKHRVIQHGLPGDIPLTGDFDGDKKADLAVWRPDSGNWYLRHSTDGYNTLTVIQWGLAGDIPLSADYDGDGVSDLSVYREASGEFYTLRSSAGFDRANALSASTSAVIRVKNGGPNYTPIVADVTGDKTAEYLTVLDTLRFWTAYTSDSSLLFSLPWGATGDRVLSCDWDSDGISDRIAIRSTETAHYQWYVVSAKNEFHSLLFGYLGDIPDCSSDIDGDSRVDPTVFRPSTGEWFIRKSSSGSLSRLQFGLPGDVPL